VIPFPNKKTVNFCPSKIPTTIEPLIAKQAKYQIPLIAETSLQQTASVGSDVLLCA
jgi:hypothetical protein